MLGKLRERYEKALAGPGRALAKLGISPNALTVLSLAVSAVSGWYYLNHNAFAGALVLLLAGAVDMLDGAVARAQQRTTRFGAVLDHVLDRYAEFLVVLGIMLGGYVDPLWAMFSLFGMIMASFTRAKAESVGGLASCTVGIAERQEKLLLILIGSAFTVVFSQALLVAIILVGILSHVTVVQRLHFTLVQTRGK